MERSDLKVLSMSAHKWLVLVALAVFSSPVGAQSDTLAGAKYDVVDRFDVNVASGQVQISQTPVSIGGAMGLRHTISSLTSDFVNFPGNGGGVPTVLGFGDAYRGGLYSVLLAGDWTYPAGMQYGVRIFGGGYNEDFSLSDNGVFIPYKRPSAASLEYQSNAQFTGYVATMGDGTRLYYPSSRITALNGQTVVRRRMDKIVYPNGFTVETSGSGPIDGSIYSVRTNTGFQLKYDFSGSWTTSSPSKVTALNNKEERCPTTSASCSPSNYWPSATYTWPVGRPSSSNTASLRVNSVFRVTDAEGRITDYHHRLYESSNNFSPRLVEIRKGGKTVRTYDYEFNQMLQYGSGIASTTYLAGIATVGRAQEPGGGSHAYSMHLPKYYNSMQVTPSGVFNISGEGFGTKAPGTIGYVETTNLSAMVRIDAWDRTVNFYYTHLIDPAYGTRHIENRVSSVNRKDGGTTVTFTYDARGNVTQRNDSGAISKAGYPASCTSSNFRYCNKPSWIEDPNGNRTYYTYHASSGQIASRTRPANKSGVRPKTTFQYSQYFAHYKKNSNTIEAADTPIWLLSSERSCQNSTMNSNGTCSGGDDVVTTYEYDYYNLYLVGVAVTAKSASGSTETRRTCYEYDALGNRIGETSPRANRSSCR